VGQYANSAHADGEAQYQFDMTNSLYVLSGSHANGYLAFPLGEPSYASVRSLDALNPSNARRRFASSCIMNQQKIAFVLSVFEMLQ
jgi:hypothetical protein